MISHVIALRIRDSVRELWQCCTGVPSGHSAPTTNHSVAGDTREGRSRSHQQFQLWDMQCCTYPILTGRVSVPTFRAVVQRKSLGGAWGNALNWSIIDLAREHSNTGISRKQGGHCTLQVAGRSTGGDRMWLTNLLTSAMRWCWARFGGAHRTHR
jgi:hypothetical protein